VEEIIYAFLRNFVEFTIIVRFSHFQDQTSRLEARWYFGSADNDLNHFNLFLEIITSCHGNECVPAEKKPIDKNEVGKKIS